MLQQGETIHRALLLTAYEYLSSLRAFFFSPFPFSLIYSSYQLSQRVELDMEGLCIVEHSSPLPGSSVNFYGELRLVQQGPLRVSPRISLPPLLSSNISSVGDVLLPSITFSSSFPSPLTLMEKNTSYSKPYEVM